MSVKRWKETESWGFTEWDCMAVMEECADGDYVLHSDYAALQAEVQRLRHRSESLREAGDELWFCLRHGKRLTHAEVQEAVEDWQSAREGK